MRLNVPVAGVCDLQRQTEYIVVVRNLDYVRYASTIDIQTMDTGSDTTVHVTQRDC